MRVRTTAQPLLRSLVRVEVQLPRGLPVRMHAVVVHISVDELTSQSVVGLELYGIGDGDRRRWLAFVAGVAETGAVREHGQAAGFVVAMHPDTVEELDVLHVNAGAGWPIFVPTTASIQPGDRLHIIAVCPETAELHTIDGDALRSVPDSDPPGVIVKPRALTVPRPIVLSDRDDADTRGGVPCN